MRWAIASAILLAAILVPFFLFQGSFDTWSESLIHDQPSPWLTALAVSVLLAGDVVLPIPSSLVSTVAGALLGFWAGVVAIWLGMTGTCVVGYALGARAAGLARRVVGADGLARAAHLAARYGDYAVVLCRPVPVLAEASVISAGLVRAPLRRFVFLTLWSNLGIAAGYAAVGAFSMRVESFLLAFAGSIVIPGVAILVSRTFGARPRSQV